jgi:hypothetical protein
MPSWKKVIVSGSDAHLNHITASGNISASSLDLSGVFSVSTGSFGRVEATTITASRIDVDASTLTVGGSEINKTIVDNVRSTLGTDTLSLSNSMVLVTNGSGEIVSDANITTTELGYLNGVSSNLTEVYDTVAFATDTGILTLTEIDGGTDTVDLGIGTGDSPTFAGLTLTGDISGDVTVQGDITAQNYIVSSSVTYMTQSFSSGSTIFGDTITDTHKFTGSLDISGSVTPGIDDKFDLGASGTQWKDLYIDGTAYLDTVDIDAGDIDGAAIGANSHTTIKGTTIDATTDFTIGDTVVTDGVITDTTGLQLAANLDINGTADISGDLTLSAGADGALRFSGASSIKILDNSATALVIEEADNAYLTFDTTDSSEQVIFNKNSTFNGTIIDNLGTVSAATSITSTAFVGPIDGIVGGNTPAAGTFTSLSATGNVDLGDATSDTITATGRFDSDLVPSSDSAQDLGTSALYWKAAYIDAITTTGNVIIGGNLEVNGTTTTLATTNLEVEDAFGFFATGSAAANVDAGIIVQSGSFADSGSALYHDITSERWSVAKGIASDTTVVTPLEHVVTVKELGDNDDAVAGDNEYGVGEMAINTDGTIWIYS